MIIVTVIGINMVLNKNVVVTGNARAGTSVTVRIVKEFGYRSIGRMFPDHAIQKFNPQGYWELNPKEYDTVGSVLATQKGRVIKLFGNFIHAVLPESIDKIIVCTRDHVPCVASCMKMFKAHKHVLTEDGTPLFDGTVKQIEDMLQRNMEVIKNWIYVNKKEMYELKLERLKENPYTVIKELSEYLNKDEIIRAVNLIKKV